MKKFIQFRIAVMLLSMGIWFTACQRNQVNPVQKTKEVNHIKARVSANAQSMDWDGNIEHDCENAGTKCAVVYPDIAVSSGWHDNCINGRLEAYIQNNGETFGFSQELLQNLINGTSINVKEGNGGYQYRPIN